MRGWQDVNGYRTHKRHSEISGWIPIFVIGGILVFALLSTIF